MTRLASLGISVDLPQGWEGMIYQRDGGQPVLHAATFPLPRLIRGWQEGVPLMSVGDRFEFAIPYNLAYGYAGRGPIPGGATLIFTIDLIAIAPPETPH
jgi:hypothetical protein